MFDRVVQELRSVKDLLPEWYEKLKADSQIFSKCWSGKRYYYGRLHYSFFETEMGIEYNNDVQEIGVVSP